MSLSHLVPSVMTRDLLIVSRGGYVDYQVSCSDARGILEVDPLDLSIRPHGTFLECKRIVHESVCHLDYVAAIGAY